MKRPIAMTLYLSAGLLAGGCPSTKNDDPGADDDGATGADGATTAPFDTQDDGPDDDSPDDDDGPGSTTELPDPTGGSESTDDGATGFMFIPLTDAGPTAVFECDLFSQDCEKGDKCMPFAQDGGGAWNATRCVPISANPGSVGDPCTVEGGGTSGVDTCGISLMCWNVDENGEGTCEDMCTGSVENPLCENPDDVCALANGGAIALCLSACDPLSQDCLIENEVCYPINDSWACAPNASGEELGAYGDTCGFINGCDAGFICVDAGAFTECAGAQCCTQVCDHTSPTTDEECVALDPGQLCEPWYVEGQAPPGYEDVGACLLPL
jgi:hypothetical protein